MQPNQTFRQRQPGPHLTVPAWGIPRENSHSGPSRVHDPQNHEQLFPTLGGGAISYTAIVTRTRTQRRSLPPLPVTHPDESAAGTSPGCVFITCSSQQNVDVSILIGSDLLFNPVSALRLSGLWFLSCTRRQNTLLCILNGVLIYYL